MELHFRLKRRLLSSGWLAAPNLSLEEFAHRVSIPMYAAELGIDPQADFAHRPESQGQLGSAVSCFLSGASRVLDRRTHLEGY